MEKKRMTDPGIAVGRTADRNKRDDALQERYGLRPSLRELYESGQIDRAAYEKANRLRTKGPTDPSAT